MTLPIGLAALVVAGLFYRINHKLERLTIMAVTQEQFDQTLAAFLAALNTSITDANTALAALLAKANAAGVDLTAESDQLTAALASVQALDQAALSDTPAA